MLTLNQVRTQVSAIRKRWPNGRPVGLQVTDRWTGPETFVLDGTVHRIVQADSELAIRQVLCETANATESLVILSSLPPQSLGEDVRARLVQPKNPLIPISSREILRELFKAKEVEPRLHGLRWMADALVEAQPPGGFPPVPGGRLDEETAWEVFLRQILGFRGGRPDLVDVIEWARDPESARRLQTVGSDAALALEGWLSRSAGPAAALVLAALQGASPVPVPALALACDVLFREDSTPELIAACGRIEQCFGGRSPGGSAGRALGQAGLGWLTRRLEEDAGGGVRAELEQLDQLLKQLRVESFARLSVASPLGLEQRYDALAAELLGIGDPPKADRLPSLEARVTAIHEHRLAASEPDRLERAQMALRLARWLALPEEADGVTSFGALARQYQYEGCFVDQARYALYHGDSQPRLARAYAELLRAGAARRERQNRVFGEALVAANQAGGGGVAGVEDVIPDLVAVLAQKGRVLLLVVDGMSLAVFRELMAALNRQGFAEAVPAGCEEPAIAMAGLPTITEWSRRLLLTGRDQAAAGVAEDVGFRGHAAFAAFNSPKQAPRLFLKASLTETGGVGLSEEVRRELAGPRPVVGVVLNAVDDHLAKGGQLHVPWTLERIPLLQQILAAAAAANRVAVLTSDHGHVVDRDTEVLRHEAGDRFREDNSPRTPAELLVRGGRVSPAFAQGFVAPWSERLIYTSRKNGYHGGLSPQEVLVPVAVLVQDHYVPDGWQVTAPRVPDWWFGPTPAPDAAPASPLPPRPAPSPVGDLPLFAAASKPAAARPWIPALFESEVFKAQIGRAGRVAPAAEVIRRVLETLEERGGVVLTAALAGRVGVPEFRLPGMLAGLRRVLNVEGYPVLSLEEDSGTVRLNLELLKSQFDLG